MQLNKKIEQEQLQLKKEHTVAKEGKKLDMKIAALAEKFKKSR